MKSIFGSAPKPLALVHGGAGKRARGKRHTMVCDGLSRIAETGLSLLIKGVPAGECVQSCVAELELSPVFNAGIGSSIQADGLIRVSAAFMESTRGRFSAVCNATELAKPSELAALLQDSPHRVLDGYGTSLLCRDRGIACTDLKTEYQEKESQNVRAQSNDTVGAVCLDASGTLAACTSTGGRTNAFPGRMSDVVSVAGTYASSVAAISTTGVGEQIVDAGLAIRLETRIRDGMTLEAACKLILDEASRKDAEFGFIAVDATGSWAVCWTTEWMYWELISSDWSGEKPVV